MHLKIAGFAALTGLMLNTITWANGIPMVVGPCITCHGAGGSSQGPAIPTIASLEKQTFIDIMQAYKDGSRPSTIMGRFAKGYTEADFNIMADYFGKQPVVRYPQKFDQAKAEQGAKHHKKYCEKCHEDNGFKDEDGTNILAGQWMPYLQFNLTDFQTGERDMPKKMQKRLQEMLEKHCEQSLDEIVNFYGSQK